MCENLLREQRAFKLISGTSASSVMKNFLSVNACELIFPHPLIGIFSTYNQFHPFTIIFAKKQEISFVISRKAMIIFLLLTTPLL